MPDLSEDRSRVMCELARTNGRTVMRNGIEWRVYELPPGVYDRRGSASLVFESGDAFRRIRAYPDDWRLLDDDDLYAVSFNR